MSADAIKVAPSGVGHINYIDGSSLIKETCGTLWWYIIKDVL
jgi:hypothetical protein